MIRWKALVFLVTLVVPVAGCGIEPGVAVRRIRLPALPADLPLPAADALRAVRDLGPRGLNLVYETEEPLQDAAGSLRARMETEGWVLLSDITLERAFFGSYRKGERAAAVGVSRSGKFTLVSVSYVARPDSESEPEGG